jgi:hypothetical protein
MQPTGVLSRRRETRINAEGEEQNMKSTYNPSSAFSGYTTIPNKKHFYVVAMGDIVQFDSKFERRAWMLGRKAEGVKSATITRKEITKAQFEHRMIL